MKALVKQGPTTMQRGSKIFGIGKSYRHGHPNLQHDALPEPMIFMKPASSYVVGGADTLVPKGCEIMEEVEIAVLIGKAGRNVGVKDAMSHVAGYALAFDLAATNVLNEAKAKGTPWDVAKGLETFTQLGRTLPVVPDVRHWTLTCKVDDAVIQQGPIGGLIYTIPQLIAYCSSTFGLDEGDIILTGTPAGQSVVKTGSTMEAILQDASGNVLDSFKTALKYKEEGFQREKYWVNALD